ncbi:sugar phosphate isomerase/epimerase family protein [Dactylosporangium sp. NPDC000521]|uniref:sugar phosphate isomerase/epimerase family protein n=1 Tax=Dactylosporangium sp. NPDC000521 TaxID=3363975 RepID=UPI0036C8D1A5
MVEWVLSGFGDEIDDDPRVQLAVLRALGASHVEVRSAWGVNVADFDDELTARLTAALTAAGVAVSAVASPIGKTDVFGDPDVELARLRAVIALTRRLRSRYVRLFSFYRPPGVAVEATRDTVLRRLRAFADLAEREQVVLLHENEKDVYGDVPARVLDLIESVGSPALRVAWDNANFVQVGVRPFSDGYAMLRPHLEYLQVKDARFADGAVVPAGEGDGELLQTVTALRDDGWTGFASLEPHLADGPDAAKTGPAGFGRAARAFAALTTGAGITLR